MPVATNIWTLIAALVMCVSARPAYGADSMRIDLQVYTAQELPIAGLQLSDFAVSANDQLQGAKQFRGENMPVDVLFLLDVSQPMKSYVTFLHDQSEAALQHALTQKDCVAIMAFDVNARMVLPFTGNQADFTDSLGREARSEQFNGAARITLALIFASAYLQRHARPTPVAPSSC